MSIPSIADFIVSLSDEERNRFFSGKILGRFYVYVLKYPDGVIFYVGKGSGDRIKTHKREARGGIRSRKCDIIRQIWASGDEFRQEKIAHFDNEGLALRLEKRLIAFIGRENLASRAKGGEGLSNHPSACDLCGGLSRVDFITGLCSQCRQQPQKLIH